MTEFPSRPLPKAYDLLAPDGSQIRLLQQVAGASVVHCTLPVGGLSLPVRHRTVEEIWFFLSGRGQVWRAQAHREETLDVSPGLSLTIPLDARFQFRNTGDVPLEFIITTTPPWPGEDEAILLDAGRWELSKR